MGSDPLGWKQKVPETAMNGAEAWALLEREPSHFDAVLLDWMMPEMDGLEVLARIKGHTERSQKEQI